MNGWSRSSPRPSRNVAASASVRATMTPGTFMTSSWKRAALSRLICSSTPTSTLPPWCPHFFGAGLLVLDVVARDPGLDETTDQIPDVRVAAVSRVSVGDDEWPIVDLGGGSTLRFAEARAGEALVPVRREQGAHDRRGLVGHLGERIAGKVGSRVLRRGSPGRCRPAAQVDALDAHPLQCHRLTGRIRTEGGDLLALGEELPEPIVKLLGRHSRHGVVRGDGAPLLHHLTRRIQTRDALESRAGKPSCGLADFRIE